MKHMKYINIFCLGLVCSLGLNAGETDERPIPEAVLEIASRNKRTENEIIEEYRTATEKDYWQARDAVGSLEKKKAYDVLAIAFRDIDIFQNSGVYSKIFNILIEIENPSPLVIEAFLAQLEKDNGISGDELPVGYKGDNLGVRYGGDKSSGECMAKFRIIEYLSRIYKIDTDITRNDVWYYIRDKSEVVSAFIKKVKEISEAEQDLPGKKQVGMIQAVTNKMLGGSGSTSLTTPVSTVATANNSQTPAAKSPEPSGLVWVVSLVVALLAGIGYFFYRRKKGGAAF